jgi:hypothetical protein
VAKGKKKSEAPASKDPGIEAFEAGHYAEARALFDEKLKGDIAQGERDLLTNLRATTLIDRQTILTGLGCIGLMVLVLLITWLKQP